MPTRAFFIVCVARTASVRRQGSIPPHAALQMPVSIATYKEVTFEVGGVAALWKVHPADLVDVSGETYVRLKPYDTSLVRLICAHAPGSAPDPVPKNYTLTASVGYRKLISLRNEAQRAALCGDEATPARSLFGARSAPTPSKAPRVPRQATKERRAAPSTMVVELPPHDRNSTTTSVSLLRPLHPQDILCVALDTEVLDAIFGFVCGHGFDNEGAHKWDRSLPKGVFKRKAGYLCKDTSGVCKHKLLKTIGAVMGSIADTEPLALGQSPIADAAAAGGEAAVAAADCDDSG